MKPHMKFYTDTYVPSRTRFGQFDRIRTNPLRILINKIIKRIAFGLCNDIITITAHNGKLTTNIKGWRV